MCPLTLVQEEVLTKFNFEFNTRMHDDNFDFVQRCRGLDFVKLWG
jgi:hypothetical protein